jgi:hypothetical protein
MRWGVGHYCLRRTVEDSRSTLPLPVKAERKSTKTRLYAPQSSTTIATADLTSSDICLWSRWFADTGHARTIHKKRVKTIFCSTTLYLQKYLYRNVNAIQRVMQSFLVYQWISNSRYWSREKHYELCIQCLWYKTFGFGNT